MITGKRQYHFQSALLKSAADNLEAFGLTKDREALHRFRVDIKKFRAWFQILKSKSVRVDFKEIMKPVLSVYRKAGDIRSLDVNLELLKTFHMPNHTLVHLLERQRATKAQQFIRSVDVYYGAIHSLELRLRDAFTDLDEKRVLGKFEKKIRKLEKQLDNRSPDRWHASRRKMKALMYAARMLPVKTRAHLHSNLSYYDKLQHAIGQWHDVETIQHLSYSKNNRKDYTLHMLEKERVRRHNKVVKILSGIKRKTIEEK